MCLCIYTVKLHSAGDDGSSRSLSILKDLYHKAAVFPAKPLALFITESSNTEEDQKSSDQFLAQVNTFLSSPRLLPQGIFTYDEIDAIVARLRGKVKQL